MITTKHGVVDHNYLLEEIAQAQWHADIPGGQTARLQLEVTDRKLKQIGMTRNSTAYKEAYERVQKNIR